MMAFSVRKKSVMVGVGEWRRKCIGCQVAEGTKESECTGFR